MKILTFFENPQTKNGCNCLNCFDSTPETGINPSELFKSPPSLSMSCNDAINKLWSNGGLGPVIVTGGDKVSSSLALALRSEGLSCGQPLPC